MYVGDIDCRASFNTEAKNHNTATKNCINTYGRRISGRSWRHHYQHPANRATLHVRAENTPTKQKVPELGVVRTRASRFLDTQYVGNRGKIAKIPRLRCMSPGAGRVQPVAQQGRNIP